MTAQKTNVVYATLDADRVENKIIVIPVNNILILYIFVFHNMSLILKNESYPVSNIHNYN